MRFLSRRGRTVSRGITSPTTLEGLESRVLFSVPEPNNTFDTAFTPSDNIYLEHNYAPSDSVNAAGDADDYYKFYTLYGPSHLYAVLNGLSNDADLYVYDQNHNQLANSRLGGNASETVNVDLPGNQYFYVRVNGYLGATNYNLLLYNDYAGSTTATARDIGAAWGQSSSDFWNYNQVNYSDYMDFRDNVDVYKFRMEAPGTVSVRRLPTQDPGGGALVTNLQLLDSGGTVLTNGSSSNNSLNIDRFTLNTGTYYVRLAQSAGSGEYQMRIVSDYAGDTTATARDLGDVTNGSRQDFDMVGGPAGVVSYEDALDLYRFSLARSSPLDLALSVPGVFSPPTFDADLFLARDTNGNGFIDSGEIQNESAATGDDALHLSVLPAGTYYVGVRQHGAYTSYQLDLDSDIDQPAASAAAYKDMSRAQALGNLTGNLSYTGGFGISRGDISDFYQFTLPAPATVTASATNDNYYSRDKTYTPFVGFVKDANGNGINDPGEIVASGTGLVTASLPAGTYYVYLAGNGQTVDYFGQLTADYAPNTLGAARAMAAISGANPPQQSFQDYIEQDFGGANDVDDFYKFTLPDSYAVTVATTGVDGEDLSLSLIKDANGNGTIDAGDVLATSDAVDSPNESLTRTLGAGTYYVRVHGVNGATNYTLNANFVASTAAQAPQVQQVSVSGSAWSLGFANYLAANGLGSGAAGYSVPAGAAQLNDLPWFNDDQVSITFNRDVQVDSADLVVHGVNVATYPVASFAYNAGSHTATWTLGRNMINDVVSLTLAGSGAGGVRGTGAGGQLLDGEWTNGADSYPSGNGTAGGDFHFQIDALPGDADRAATRRVTAIDLGYVKARMNRNATEVPPAGFQPYSAYADMNGDAKINAIDLGAVKARLNNALPTPAAAAGAGELTGLAPASITRDLFAVAPIG